MGKKATYAYLSQKRSTVHLWYKASTPSSCLNAVNFQTKLQNRTICPFTYCVFKMYFAHPLKIFALVKARDEDMHSPQQAGNLLQSKSSSRISIIQMYSQQQWITSVHKVEAGFSNWQGIPPSSKFYFLFCHWSMWNCKLPHFSGASLLPFLP